MTGEATVAAVDIARLAGVGRAAVSNWRRRFADFPAPVGGTTSNPLFPLDAVERWLAEHDRGIDVSAEDRLWQWLRTEVDDLRLGDLVGDLGAFLAVLDRAPATWQRLAATPDDELARTLGPAVTTVVPGLAGAFPELAGPDLVAAVRRVADIATRSGAARTFDFLVHRYVDAHSRRLPVTPTSTAELIVALADVRDRTVLDPACGTGNLLTTAAESGAAMPAGQEANPALARLAGARLLLGHAGGQVVAGDALRADAYTGTRFGAVVCNPPWGDRRWGYDELAGDTRWEYGLPPRGEPELAWVQHCVSHAETGAAVVVAVPAAVAARRAGRRIRGNLLRAGVLRSIVGLPSDGGVPCDLWVLRVPHAGEPRPSHLLVVAADEPSVVPPLWAAFLAGTGPGDGPQSRALPLIDLLDDEVDISPARLVPAPSPVDRLDLPGSRSQLAAALDALPAALPEIHLREVPRELPMTTIGEMAKAGSVTIAQAPLRMALDSGDVIVLTTKDLTARRGPTGRTTDQPGLVHLRPGDVVVAVLAGPNSPVHVVEEPGGVLGPRLVCLRAAPDRLDPDFLAGFLRVAAGSTPPRTSTGASRADVRKLPVALLPLAEQRAYGVAFRALADFLDSLRECAAAGESLVRLTAQGLAGGTLSAGN